MNIFYTSTCPLQSADWLCDEHLHKMPLESVQLLSTLVRHKISNHDWLDSIGIYKLTHDKHPSYLWLTLSSANYQWLVDHVRQMQARYNSAYSDHDSFYVLDTIEDLYARGILKFPTSEPTNIHLAMGKKMRSKKDPDPFLDIKQKYAEYKDGLWIANTPEDGALAYQEYVCRKLFLPTKKVDKVAGNMRLPVWRSGHPEWYKPHHSTYEHSTYTNLYL